MSQRYSPTVFIALLNLVVLAVINGFQLITQIPISYINKWIMLGVDYQDFYQASLQIINKDNPYQVVRYVTPPWFAVANVPLALLSFNAARALFLFLIVVMVFFSYLSVANRLKDSEQSEWFVFTGLFVILFSYPFYFLFERGNIDGVVLFLMCLGLLVMPKQPWIGGLLLALAVHFKLYPVLLLPALLVARRWKPLLWTGAWIAILAILVAPYWDDFAILLSKRSNLFQLFENGSLINTFLFLGMFLSKSFHLGDGFWTYAPSYAVALYTILFSVLVLADTKLSRATSSQQQLVNALLYFPFMLALPKSVYHYEFVVLLPLLPALDYLWKNTTVPSQRVVLWVIALGLALSQWQAVALYALTSNDFAYYIPGLGLLLTLLGISVYKFMQLQSLTKFSTFTLPES
jgi:hypothetical protein